MKDYLKGKTILLTGGVGSIGREIARHLLKFSPRVIRIFDNNETGLFDLEQELKSPKIRPFFGDIKDRSRLKRAIEGVDIVFHAAASKHVPLCEFNPFEALKTNAIGTQNVIEAAIDEEVGKFINISTDKAVNPSNVMGATKLLAERLTVSANFYKGKRKTVFSCVRFGNVFGTNGSVIPVFKKQIKAGGPLTITDPDMTRFVMSIPKAVELVLKAADMARGGEIFIFKMPSLRVGDLAEVMIEELAEGYGHVPEKIKIKVIGRRAGEKFHEELMTKDESEGACEEKEMFVVLPKTFNITGTNKLSFKFPDGFKKAKKEIYSSESQKALTKAQIKSLIKKIGLV